MLAGKAALQQAVKASAAALDALRRPPAGVVVLIYHRVGGGSGLEIDLPVARVRRTDGVARRDRPCGHARRRARRCSRRRLRRRTGRRTTRRAIVITFDDGTADFADHAVPVLARHGDPGDAVRRHRVHRRRRRVPGRRRPGVVGGAPRRAARPGWSTSARTRTAPAARPAPAARGRRRARPVDRPDRRAPRAGAARLRVPEGAARIAPRPNAPCATRFRSAAVAGTRAEPVRRDRSVPAARARRCR